MLVRKAVDLSLSIDEHTQIYPGDPAVRLAPAATIDADGFNILSVEMGSQSGTNCDAPDHFLPDGARIDETPDDSHPGAGYPVHKLIAAAGGVIVENLTNIDLIDFPRPLITVFPLKLTGADGAPTRAVAIDLSP